MRPLSPTQTRTLSSTHILNQQWLRLSRWSVVFNLDLLSLTDYGAPAVLGKSNLGYSPWGEMEQSIHRYFLPIGCIPWLLVSA